MDSFGVCCVCDGLRLSHDPATTFTTTFGLQAVVLYFNRESSRTACHCGYSDEHVHVFS